ncbi:hypothetical protein BUALT_Bualt03G0224800 [Buddleja alternifolia]|uniref:Uncharacterized protein n=1 Tax=Buddleja alternifolia TaxID=168488 RepID=A0AAV6Y783_9LAMI|nr:hypothetical protein BUALT_Bualt03G0224800 [Buddleja alternifolia]
MRKPYCANTLIPPSTSRQLEMPTTSWCKTLDFRRQCEAPSPSRRSSSFSPSAKSKNVAKAVGEYQYPWREKLTKYKDELPKGVWGYSELGAWKPLSISARRRARLRKEVLVGGDWEYDPERKEMKTKRKGHKVDRLAAEKRERTA